MMMSSWRAWAEIVLSPCEGEFLVVRVTFRLFRANGLVLVACGQDAGRLRTCAFVVVQCVPLPLFFLGRFCPILVLPERRVNNGIQEELLVFQQVVAQQNVAPLRLMFLLLRLLFRCPRQLG